MIILAIKFLQYIYLYVSIDFLSFCGMNRITIWLNDMFLILQGLRKGTSSFFLLKSLKRNIIRPNHFIRIHSY